MFTLGSIGFTAPWLLLGLAALPVLWILLRAVPPAPIRRRFPGVALLLGLADEESQADRTPWWLLLMRMLAVAALIFAFAGPVLNPEDERAGSGPLLILTDGTWAEARDWDRRGARIEELLEEAERAGRPVAVVRLTDPPAGGLPFQSAAAWTQRLPGIAPLPWEPVGEDARAFAEGLEGRFETQWISDGLERPSRAPLLAALRSAGEVTVFESPRPVYGLAPARFEDGALVVPALRADTAGAAAIAVQGFGLDPAGVERALARAEAVFAPGEGRTEVRMELPAELRNRITRFAVEGQRTAGAVSLTDDALRRREVALIAGRDNREGLELLSPLHYLEQALEPSADLVDGSIDDILLANPDVIVLADVARVSDGEAANLEAWVEAGGLLLRFAGPRLAASDVSRDREDRLMPVRLREGGRMVGGAMSWGAPRAIAPFPPESPFFGLAIPDDVSVSAQVMAQPDPELAARVIASLADGTPLVTRKALGEGSVVLFHVTANAEWSSLPLSGLFVQMLERLAVSTRPAEPDAGELEGTTWQPVSLLTAFGQVEDAGTMPGVPGERIAEARPGPDAPPGVYADGDRSIALNVLGPEAALAPARWPSDLRVEGLATAPSLPLKGLLLVCAMVLLAADLVASLWLSGRLQGARGAGRTRSAGAAGTARSLAGALALAAGLVLGGAGGPGAPGAAMAQTGAAPGGAAADDFAVAATSEVVLAHVVTGDAELDALAAAGLRGLTDTLIRRTSVEPAAPIEVNLETDELAFFPLLYWPVTPAQPTPSDEAYARLNEFLRGGGMIVFDTRDADTARFGAASPNGRKLQELARPLDIPPLEPVPDDHVLTRTFYLLQDFPGRHASRDVWVEAAPPDAERIEGMPFRDLNDGVTPVVIGGNDWAAAWATDEAGNPVLPVGRGFAGERQRELARRFGVNLVMHVLTGNYKSDQVHVPALLDRLGQ